MSLKTLEIEVSMWHLAYNHFKVLKGLTLSKFKEY
jgi:hypothetical protein